MRTTRMRNPEPLTRPLERSRAFSTQAQNSVTRRVEPEISVTCGELSDSERPSEQGDLEGDQEGSRRQKLQVTADITRIIIPNSSPRNLKRVEEAGLRIAEGAVMTMTRITARNLESLTR